MNQEIACGQNQSLGIDAVRLEILIAYFSLLFILLNLSNLNKYEKLTQYGMWWKHIHMCFYDLFSGMCFYLFHIACVCKYMLPTLIYHPFLLLMWCSCII